MKTNKMMRLASILLVAVMISTCAISGTFAKYVTSDSAKDEARVAKWGIVVEAEGTLFSETYLTGTNTPGDGVVDGDGTVLSVEVGSTDVKNLVAPGTKNDNGITFSITGTAEVDLAIALKYDAKNEVIFLNAGTYKDMTTGDVGDDFKANNKHEPVVFTLKQKKTGEGSFTALVTDVTYDKLCAELNKINDDHIDANTDLGTIYGEYQLTWQWKYEVDDATDKADTVLGALAAGTYEDTTLADTEYNLDIYFGFSIKATQID